MAGNESIDIKLKQAAIILAEERSYSRAAEKLNMKPSELRKLICELEGKLCFYMFRTDPKRVFLTEVGAFLVHAFRDSLALHNIRNRLDRPRAPDAAPEAIGDDPQMHRN
jgi:DNA-binding transcriptional LysR family regulator